jgi:hypothetical protein
LPSQLPTQQELVQLKLYYTNLKTQLHDLKEEASRSTYKFLIFKSGLFKANDTVTVETVKLPDLLSFMCQ